MRRIFEFALVVFIVGAAAGCGATRPVKYYVIDTPTAPANTSATQYPVRISVGRISSSQLYRMDRIVYGSGPVQLGTYTNERWASIPADMIQDLVVSSLRSTGQYVSVSKLGTSSRPDYIVRGNLISLYEVDQPELVGRFALRLELYDPKSGNTVWVGNYSHDEPVNGRTVADVVEALNRNVQAGLQQLTSQIGAYFASHPPSQQSSGE
jgi:ABC-type uncharacterized transport system auxiliary subunit